MPRYLILRTFDVDETEMPAVGRRSRQVIEQQLPDVTWEHSHVLVDENGTVQTYCVYAAPDEDAIREHSKLLGQHTLDLLREIAGDVTPADFPPAD
jgi:Protein of unknown function (DUF4242)